MLPVPVLWGGVLAAGGWEDRGVPEAKEAREGKEGALSRPPTMAERGDELGRLVASKRRQYGDSVGRTAEVLRVYFPGGIAVHQYGDLLLLVRVLDKLSRIAQRREDGKDLGGESPWQDIGGYGLLGWAKDEER